MDDDNRSYVVMTTVFEITYLILHMIISFNIYLLCTRQLTNKKHNLGDIPLGTHMQD